MLSYTSIIGVLLLYVFNHLYILCILSAHSTCLVKIFAPVNKWIIQCPWGSGRQTLFYATSENRHFYNLTEGMWRKNNDSMFIIVRDHVFLIRPTLRVPVSFNSLEGPCHWYFPFLTHVFPSLNRAGFPPTRQLWVCNGPHSTHFLPTSPLKPAPAKK